MKTAKIELTWEQLVILERELQEFEPYCDRDAGGEYFAEKQAMDEVYNQVQRAIDELEGK